ncbi:MAG: DinB family protein [Acidobacteriota bacterium]|nr:DinB family protein [Acidobacteriota bacterium]
MRRSFRFAFAFLPLAFATALPVAAADNPAVQHLLDRWNKSRDYTIELAQQMPAESYVSRPNDAEMTFGEQVVHIADGILFMIQNYPSGKVASFDQKKADKETAIADLKRAFDAGAAAIGTLSDADLLTKIVDTGEGKMTANEAMLLLFEHVEHHRGQIVVYLRFKNIKPVDYRF